MTLRVISLVVAALAAYGVWTLIRDVWDWVVDRRDLDSIEASGQTRRALGDVTKGRRP